MVTGQGEGIFYADAFGGKLQLRDREGLDRFVSGLEGKEVELAIRLRRRRRSDSANAYFHGVVCKLISEHLGYELEEVKELLKSMFLKIERDGRSFCRPTSSLDSKAMWEFIDRCIRWAAIELNLVIPDPRRVG